MRHRQAKMLAMRAALARAMLAGTPDLTVSLPVLACTFAKLCELVCISACVGQYLSLYWYVFRRQYWHVLKIQVCIGLYLHVSLFDIYQTPSQYVSIVLCYILSLYWLSYTYAI